MMTHDNIEAASRSIITYLQGRSDDIVLNVLPLAFDYGLYQLLMTFRLGATLVLEKSFAFLRPCLISCAASVLPASRWFRPWLR